MSKLYSIKRKLFIRAISFALVLTVCSLQVPFDIVLAYSLPRVGKSEKMLPANINVAKLETLSGDYRYEWQNIASLWTADVGEGGVFDNTNSAYLIKTKQEIQSDLDLGAGQSEESQPADVVEEGSSPRDDDGTNEILETQSDVDQNEISVETPEEEILEQTEEVDVAPEESISITEEIISFLKGVVPTTHAQELTGEIASDDHVRSLVSSDYIEFSGLSYNLNSKNSTTTISSAELKILVSKVGIQKDFILIEYSVNSGSWNVLEKVDLGNISSDGLVSIKLPSEAISHISDLNFRLSYKYDESEVSSDILVFVDSFWVETWNSFINLKLPSKESSFKEEQISDIDEKLSSLELSTQTIKMTVPGSLDEPFLFEGETSSKEKLSIVPVVENTDSELMREDGFLVYKNVYQDTNLRYETVNNGLKEYIDLLGKGHPSEFNYRANLFEFDVVQTSDTEIELYKKGNKNNPLFKLYTIKAPVMYDSAGNTSTQIVLSVGGDFIKLVPDSGWLSSATYPVVVDPLVEISVLNVHSHPSAGDIWQVDFTTSGVADLVITPADQATVEEDEFMSLFCGEEDRTEDVQILAGDIIYYPNWSCGEVGRVSHMTLVAGNHHLKFQFGDAFSEAFNAAYVWDGGGADAFWSTAANWSSDIVPGSSDTVTFNNTCVSNCDPVINANTSVLGITMAATYAGTITLNGGYTLTIGTSGFSQSAGTFNGGTGTTTTSGGFTISGGTFNAASTTEFTGNSTTININATQDFYNLVMNGNSIASKTISSGDVLVVNGTLFLSRGNVATGNIQAKGNIIQASNMEGSSAVVDFANDSLAQTWTVNGGTGPIFRLDSLADASDSIVINANAGFYGATITPAFSGVIPVVNSSNYDLAFGTGGYLQAAGTFNGGTGTTTFSATLTISGGTFNAATNTRITGLSHTLNIDTTQTFYNLIFHPTGGSGKTLSSGDSFVVLNELQINDGFLHGPGALEARGNVTVASTFDGGTTNLFFTGSSTSGSATQYMTVASSYLFDGDMTVNKSEGEVVLLSNLLMNASNQDLVISSGTLNLNGYDLSATGTSNTIRVNGGTLKLNGSETITGISIYPTFSPTSTVEYSGSSSYTLKDYNYGGLSISGSGTFAPASSTLNIYGNFTLSGGTFNASNTTNVYGDWVRNGGTFNHNNQTVSLFGGNQTVYGSNTFYNLTKSTTTSFALNFASGTTQTILNNLTLQGASGNLLSLLSNDTGEEWSIDPQGARNISYVSVRDSNNINASNINIVGSGSANLGNNTNWSFGEVFTQSDYRWYQNVDSLSLATPLASENSSTTITLSSDPLRLRMNVLVAGIDMAPSSQSFKLQVSNLTSGGWYDVGATSTVSFYNNPSLTSQTTLTNLLLTTSNATGTYEEANPSGANPFTVLVGELFELDFSLNVSSLVANANYFFRLVFSDGTPLDFYDNYAEVLYDPNSNPNAPSNLGSAHLVNGSWDNDNTPTLFFTITDPDTSDTVRYHLLIDDTADFSSPVVNTTSALQSQGLFGYYSPSALPDGSYYWRVSASDGDGASSATTTANSGSVAFRIDTTNPVAGTPTISEVTSSSITVSIAGSSDNSALSVTPYTFRNDTTGGTSGATTTDTWTFSSLSPSTSYSFYVRVTDAAGNFVNSITVSGSTLASVGSGSGGSSSGSSSGNNPVPIPPPSPVLPIPTPVENPTTPTPPTNPNPPTSTNGGGGDSGGETTNSSSGSGSGSSGSSSGTPRVPGVIETVTEGVIETVSSGISQISNGVSTFFENSVNSISNAPGRMIYFTRYTINSVQRFSEYIPEEEIKVGLGTMVIAPATLALQYSIAKGGILVNISNLRDLWVALFGFFQGVLTTLGLRKRRRYWGTVYDAVNKQGIDPAIVELVDSASGKVVERSVTDLFGRFGFLERPGTYTIRASKTHYKFPSDLVKGYADGVFNNVYHGEEFDIRDIKDVIAPNIPMDPIVNDWNQEEKARQGVGKLNTKFDYIVTLLLKLLFWVGFVIMFILLTFKPTFINALFMFVYLILAWLNKYIPDPQLSGKVVSSKYSTENLILELRYEAIPSIVVAKTVTDKKGRFFLKCAPGEYILLIKSIGDNENTTIKELKVKVGEEMILNKVFEI